MSMTLPKARIYSPRRSAMQPGQAGLGQRRLEFVPVSPVALKGDIQGGLGSVNHMAMDEWFKESLL